ncbi:MAG: hypothetical protein HOO67_06305 [Candidatus Peribacteraceae bacterium]|nr:hypothetical protein [Candidatus Peribacteraceae bacterium]
METKKDDAAQAGQTPGVPGPAGPQQPARPPAERDTSYLTANLGSKPFTDAQQKILQDKTDPEDLDILPTGEVYLTQVKYRMRLNKAFGAGGWALCPIGKPILQSGVVMREYAFYVDGRFIAEAIGECEYQESNKRMTYAQALEGAKSNALVRCCKDIGIAAECWDKRFVTQFQKDHCVRVWRDRQKYDKPQWRRKDAEPWYDEQGVVEDRPRKAGSQLPERPDTGRQAAPATGVTAKDIGFGEDPRTEEQRKADAQYNAPGNRDAQGNRKGPGRIPSDAEQAAGYRKMTAKKESSCMGGSHPGMCVIKPGDTIWFKSGYGSYCDAKHRP